MHSQCFAKYHKSDVKKINLMMHLNVGLHLVYLVLFIALRNHVFVWMRVCQIATTAAIKSIKWTRQCCVCVSKGRGLWSSTTIISHSDVISDAENSNLPTASRPLARGTVWLVLRPFVPDLICLTIYSCSCPINLLPSWVVLLPSYLLCWMRFS